MKSFNASEGYFEIAYLQLILCPVCKVALLYRDSRLRHSIDNFGAMTLYLLDRLRCPVCGKLHTAIPDFIQPRRHYDSQTIQGVLDGGGRDCAADDSTMRRWRADFAEAKEGVEQRLASEHAKAQDAPVPVCAGNAILTGLRETNPRWLAFVMEMLINSGRQHE
jgi:hypothetical protein